MALLDLQAMEPRRPQNGGGDEDSGLSVTLCEGSTLSLTQCA
jgi:SapB morphogen precursor RamS